MKQSDKQFLGTLAVHLPGAACVTLGTISALHGNPIGTELSGVGIAYIGLLMAYQQALEMRSTHEENAVHERADHAAVMRPQPGIVGSIVSVAFLHANCTPAQWEAAEHILASVTNVRPLTKEEKHTFGYPNKSAVFATNRNFVTIDGRPDDIPDLVKASAAGALLQDDAAKTMPLVKPAAIRMALLLHQYPNVHEAVKVWNESYHIARGHAALENAYRDIKEDLGAVISDGPIALEQRKGTIMGYGEYRYLGFDSVAGVQTKRHAYEIAHTIAERGVYDIDKKRYVSLHPAEIDNLAKLIYANRHEHTKEQTREFDLAH